LHNKTKSVGRNFSSLRRDFSTFKIATANIKKHRWCAIYRRILLWKRENASNFFL